MLIDAPPQKIFEKPDAGAFLGVLADITYTENVPTPYGPKPKVTFKWILNAKDKEGNYHSVIRSVNRTMGLGSDLYKMVEELLGTAPPVPYDVENLIGTVRNLVISRTTGVSKRTGKPTEYANITATFPAGAGQVFAVPANYVRTKDKPAKGAQPTQAATVITSAPTQAAPAPAASQTQDDSAEVEF
jgi:hypothetical protein